MPDYLLGSAITLAACTVISIVFFVLQISTEEGKIQLPVDSEELGNSDPFDVIKPIDLVDGLPIDEESFWRQV
jgi:hypothetical protein